MPGARDTISINIVHSERARGRELFRTGRVGEYDLATSGGSDLFRYYAAGGYENTTGVDAGNSVDLKSGRLNLSLTPSNSLNLGFNVSYIASTDVFIEKELDINQEIEKLRLHTTSTLLSGRREC